MNTWITFFLLQLQCGSQQWGEINLRYGTAVVIEESSLPRALSFQEYDRDQSNHPWCEIFNQAFKNGGTIKVLIDPEGQIVCVDRC